MSFVKDVKAAEVYEVLTCEQLERVYPGCEIKRNTGRPEKGTHPADIELTIDGQVTKIEVKHDIMSAKTGNLCIEEACLVRGDADYLLYYADYDDGTLFLFDKSTLLRRLETLAIERQVRVVGNAGDARKQGWKNKHKVFLVPIKFIYHMRILAKRPPFDAQWLEEYKNILNPMPF